MFSFSLLLAFSSAAIWAAVNIFQKDISPKLGPSATSIVVLVGGLIPIVAYMLLSGMVLPGVYSTLAAVGAGILFGVASLLFYKALETEHVVNAKAIGLVQPVMILFFSVLVLSESIKFVTIIGAIVVFTGSFLICVQKHLKFDSKLLPAFYANLAWGSPGCSYLSPSSTLAK